MSFWGLNWSSFEKEKNNERDLVFDESPMPALPMSPALPALAMPKRTVSDMMRQVKPNDVSFMARRTSIEHYPPLSLGRSDRNMKAQNAFLADDSVVEYLSKAQDKHRWKKIFQKRAAILIFLFILVGAVVATLVTTLDSSSSGSASEDDSNDQDSGSSVPQVSTEDIPVEVVPCSEEAAEAVRVLLGELLSFDEGEEIRILKLNIECLPKDAFKYVEITSEVCSFIFSESNSLSTIEDDAFSSPIFQNLQTLEFADNRDLVSLGNQTLPALDSIKLLRNPSLRILPQTLGTTQLNTVDFTACRNVQFNPFPDFLDGNKIQVLALDEMFLTTTDLLDMVQGMEGFRSRNFRAPFTFAEFPLVSIDSNVFEEIPTDFFNADFFDFSDSDEVVLSIGFDDTLEEIDEEAFIGQQDTRFSVQLERAENLNELPIGLKTLERMFLLNVEGSGLSEIEDDFFEDVIRTQVFIAETPLSIDCEALEGIFDRIGLISGSEIHGVDCLCGVHDDINIFCGSSFLSILNRTKF